MTFEIISSNCFQRIPMFFKHDILFLLFADFCRLFANLKSNMWMSGVEPCAWIHINGALNCDFLLQFLSILNLEQKKQRR